MNRLYFGLIGLLLTACQAEQWQATGGGLQITLGEDLSVATRATPAELDEPAKERFNLKIFNDARTVYEGSYRETVIPAPADTYTVTAEYGDNAMLALDAPYYKGEQTGVVVPESEHATQVTVECAVANALASVKYANKEEFDDLFSSYSVRVTVENNYVVLGRNGQSEGQSAYYRAGTIPTFEFTGTLKDNGQEVSKELNDEALQTADNFAAARHCILTLSLQPSASGVILNVEKVEAENVTLSETIPVSWMPKPKVEAEGFEGNTLNFVETESKSAAIRLNTASALQDMTLQFQFEDPQLTNFNTKEYQLSTLTDEDRTALTETLGLTLPTIGETSPTLSLDNLIARLQTNAGTTTENTLTIDVQANDRWSSDDDAANRVYTLQCNRPEFSVSVDPANCWSREFTIDEITVTGNANAETLKSNLVYQYYNGTDWVECTTREQVAGRTQQFAAAAENIAEKTYRVRALYRGAIASAEVEATLETPAQLPNSGMEEWYIEEKKASGFASPDKTYYTFHPYTEGNANSSWWATNNDEAQGGTIAFGIWYEGCFASCVSYTEDVHGGTKAALIYVSGCGDGYANTSGTYVGGAMVGSLFIGSYNSGIVQGHDFKARPTSMSFWYKYKPYNSDAFKIVVSLKNGENEIATGTYEPTTYSTEDNAYNMATVDLNYTSNEKATVICVQFLASNSTSLSESNFAKGTTINYPVIGDWTVHMGSILKIDDISLVYDK